jgi:hypothetical protein
MTTQLMGSLTLAKYNINPNSLGIVNPYLTDLTTPKNSGLSRNTVSNVVYHWDINPAFLAQQTGIKLLKVFRRTSDKQIIKNLVLHLSPTNGAGVPVPTGAYTITFWQYSSTGANVWTQYDSLSSYAGTGAIELDIVQYNPQEILFIQLNSITTATNLEIRVDGISLMTLNPPTN